MKRKDVTKLITWSGREKQHVHERRSSRTVHAGTPVGDTYGARNAGGIAGWRIEWGSILGGGDGGGRWRAARREGGERARELTPTLGIGPMHNRDSITPF